MDDDDEKRVTELLDDSVEASFNRIGEIISGMPRSAQMRAHRFAGEVINAIDRMQRDYPRDPVVAIGAAYAVFFTAKYFRETQDKSGSGIKLITL